MNEIRKDPSFLVVWAGADSVSGMNPSGPRPQLKPWRVPFVAALKAHLSWALGTASILVASRAWAQGDEDALGAVFGLGLTLLVVGAVGLVMLFLNLTGRHRPYSIVLGILSGLGTVVMGMGLSEPLLSGSGDGLMEALLWGVVLLGVGEVLAAVLAMRPGRSRSASSQRP